MQVCPLIILSGQGGSGKDAVADILKEDHGWTSFSLATPLKRFVGDMFGFTDAQLYGPSSARNEPDVRWARPCGVCKTTGVRPAYYAVPSSMTMHVPCDDCGGTGKINDNSPRRVLQLLGEEYLRQMIHVDALTMRARPDIEKMLTDGLRVVVTDARNDNDRNNLHDWLGGHRVDVRTCRPRKRAAWREHMSERRLAKDDQVEHIIQNDEKWPFPSLKSRVREMLEKLNLA